VGSEMCIRDRLGKLPEEPRMLLHASVVDADGRENAPVLLMNDAVLSRETQGAMITLRVWQKGEEVAAYRGDGLVVATAAGSTAYSLAAGGPVLSPDLAALVLTPLASHSLTTRPIVLPVDAGLEVEAVDTAGRGFVYLQLDGQIRKQVADGWRVRIRPANERFRHLGSGPGHFFRVLRAKFGFAGILPPAS
jgi:NAD+ kinase